MSFLSVVYTTHVTSRWFTSSYTLTIIVHFFSFYVHSFYPVEPSRPDTKVATYYHYSFTRIIYNPQISNTTKVWFYVDPCPVPRVVVRFMRYASVLV